MSEEYPLKQKMRRLEEYDESDTPEYALLQAQLSAIGPKYKMITSH